MPAGSLRANPKNWRKHPAAQRDALRGALEQVGMADAVLARETPSGLELIDGHLRAELADDQIVPVLVLDVTQEEADLLLASHDALTGLAEKDQQKFNDLTASLEAITSDALRWALRKEYAPREGEEPPAGLDS